MEDMYVLCNLIHVMLELGCLVAYFLTGSTSQLQELKSADSISQGSDEE